MTSDQAERFRIALHAASLVEIRGPLQNVDGVVHVKLRHLAPLDLGGVRSASQKPMPSTHDYR